MKFLLTSGGLRNDAIVHVLEELLGKSLKETKVLFVTTAANTGHDDKRWLIDDLKRFEGREVKSIDLIDFAGLPESVWKPHFEHADLLCFGGGDEFYLARMMEVHHMKEYLMELLKTKVYMGISAGSMVLGKFLSPDISKKLFDEDFGSEPSTPLEFLNFAYIPHLNSLHFPLRKETVEGVKDSFTSTTYATDDETALQVVDGIVSKVGMGVFSPTK
jgi:dipeptidase E